MSSAEKHTNNELDVNVKKRINIFKKFDINLQIIYLFLGYLGLSVFSLIVDTILEPFKGNIASDSLDAIHLFITYLLGTLAMIIIGIFNNKFQKYIKNTIKLKEGVFEGIAFGALIFACSTMYSLIITWIFGNIGSNDNQSALDTAFSAQPLLMFFCVVIFAPITEELTYRYGLFGLLSRKIKIVGYIVTTIVFALIHFNFTSSDLLKEFLLLPSYLIGAILLTYAFGRKGNIITSIIAHSTYNFSQYILMCISTFILKQ